jgi:hypothetical protein
MLFIFNLDGTDDNFNTGNALLLVDMAAGCRVEDAVFVEQSDAGRHIALEPVKQGRQSRLEAEAKGMGTEINQFSRGLKAVLHQFDLDLMALKARNLPFARDGAGVGELHR